MIHKIAIVGGSDFIGARLAVHLNRCGEYRVSLLDSAQKPNAFPTGVEFVTCNVLDRSDLERSLLGTDIIVNCVSGTASNILRSAEALYAVVNSFGTRLVQLSTLAAYGSATGSISEESPLLGDVDAYAAARAQVDYLAERNGVVRLRPGIIYGPGSTRWSGQIARLLSARRLGDLGSAGDGYCNLIFISDLLSVMQEVLNRPNGIEGAVNLCSSERVTWNEYFVRYARALRATPVRRITSRRLKIETKLLAPPLKVSAMLAGRRWRRLVPELLSPSMLRVFGQDILMDASKAARCLSVKWTPIDSGLTEAAAWYDQWNR